MEELSLNVLQQTHQELRAVVARHQLALLAGDLPLARERFLEVMDALETHAVEEDNVLVPPYKDRCKPSSGGDWRNFTGEHEKVRLFLARIWQKVEDLPKSADVKLATIALFDDESRFKELLEHHFKREEIFLFPELDRALTDDEKRAALGKLTLHFA